MASLQQDPSGNFHIKFRFAGKQYRRSLHTIHQRTAESMACHVEENIRLINTGRLELPDDADVPTFLLSDGKLVGKPKHHSELTISSLLPAYEASLPTGALEPTTQKTMRLHIRHFERLLGGKKSLRSLSTSDLQQYVTARSKEKGHRGNVSAATIRKEIATLCSLWNWAVAHNELDRTFPRKGLIFPKRTEKPPFQTVGQIRRQLAQRKFTRIQTLELWDAAYLDKEELGQLLLHIEKNSRQPFLYPMSLLAAHTGARRSELCRLNERDINLHDSTVTIHERKRNKSARTTRVVPLSSQLSEVLKEWITQKPGSEFLFPEVHDCFRERKEQDVEGAMQPDEASHHLSVVLSGSEWEPLRGWHVFRHSFISNCATQGVDQRFIDAWVGHQTDEQRRRYRHLFPDAQKQAIDSVFT